MLTEETDIPDVQTVFITRETKSDVLLTPTIGRALRALRMGVQKKPIQFAFIDIWKYEIKWAGYGQILPKIADNEASESHGLSPEVILADLVRRLAQQMDITQYGSLKAEEVVNQVLCTKKEIKDSAFKKNIIRISQAQK